MSGFSTLRKSGRVETLFSRFSEVYFLVARFLRSGHHILQRSVFLFL